MKKYGNSGTNKRPTGGNASFPSGTKVDVNGQGGTCDLVKDTNQIKGAAK